MTQLNPYINFNGNCREAMNFYRECFGGQLMIQTVEGSPIETQCPPAIKDQVLHSSLTKDGIVLMGTDMTGPDGCAPGNNIAVSVSCSSEEEINHFFSKLSEGGKIICPLKIEFWGAYFCVIADKFGIGWMFNYDPNQNQEPIIKKLN